MERRFAKDVEHFKVLIVGSDKVGKTSLLLRFVEEKFTSTYMPTLSFDYFQKDIMVSREKVSLQLWDTIGFVSYMEV